VIYSFVWTLGPSTRRLCDTILVPDVPTFVADRVIAAILGGMVFCKTICTEFFVFVFQVAPLGGVGTRWSSDGTDLILEVRRNEKLNGAFVGPRKGVVTKEAMETQLFNLLL